MTNAGISHPQDLLPTLDLVMKDPRPLVVLAEKIDGGALGMLVANNQHGTIEAVAMRAPGFGHRRIQHLGDLAAFTGGQVIAEEAGLSLASVRREHLGTARRVIVTADGTTFVEGGGTDEAVRERLAQIRAELARASQERDVEILQERLARLALSLAVIRVGAPTEPALRDRFRRTEGALAATQAAVSEGIVAGGGTALLRAGVALDSLELEGDYARGVEVVRSVLAEPLYWIASNAGYDSRATIDQVAAMPEGHGLDALTGEFGDLFEKGVVDPVRVTRLSLEHAASVAALLLTTEALVAEELIAQPGAIVAPGFGDLAEGLARPSSPI
jgi:chaperonin GroEL